MNTLIDDANFGKHKKHSLQSRCACQRLTQKPGIRKKFTKSGGNVFLSYKKQCIPKIMAKKDLKVGMQNPDFDFWVCLWQAQRD